MNSRRSGKIAIVTTQTIEHRLGTLVTITSGAKVIIGRVPNRAVQPELGG